MTQRNIIDKTHKESKLSLVDLSGSENVSKTRAEGLRLREAGIINKSLTVLGKIINILSVKPKNKVPQNGRRISNNEPVLLKKKAYKKQHIPYRESTLTKLLADSLGGNSKTIILLCCSPSSLNKYDTLSTLRFGTRAKRVKNTPKINHSLTPATLKLQLLRAKREIKRLKSNKLINSLLKVRCCINMKSTEKTH